MHEKPDMLHEKRDGSIWITALVVATLMFPTLMFSTSSAMELSKGFVPCQLSDHLSDRLGSFDPEDELDLVVRYDGSIDDGALSSLFELGFKVKYTFSAIPAVHVTGPAKAIEGLSQMEGALYIEDSRPVTRDMEVSNSVINASRLWNRAVRDGSGEARTIDGSGITVAVVDTGIDAGHPDLDYGDKTLFNLYYDGISWVEMENSDLNYGHGTHVAGTVAGNGDASAGARRGVAPGANLIGLSVNVIDGSEEIGYLKALDWVYANSRPNSNPYNIKVATNSWHITVCEYDPQSALSKVIEALTFENNVVTTWSAGNDGRDDPEGQGITTSGEGNTPSAICVAAYEHDGGAVADFSSRGQVGLNHTYPDIGAPGVRIWSTSARRTLISGGTFISGNTNPYYLAISGTSMSTPHVAGLVALLFDAAPSLTISELHEDYSGDDPEGWYTNPLTRIHEVEWILEASALHLEPIPEHGVLANDKNSTGWDGRPIDYVQGYGIVDAEKAVGIALTLDHLRQTNPGISVTVRDAIAAYEDSMVTENVSGSTDVVTASWDGEFSRYSDQFNKPLTVVNQTKYVYVPEGSTKAIVDLTYAAVDLTEGTVGDLAFTIDFNADGEEDYTGSISPQRNGHKHEELTVGDGTSGAYWKFDMIGEGGKVQRPFQDHNYAEFRMEYSMSVQFVLESSENGSNGVENHRLDPLVAPLKLGVPSLEYGDSNINLRSDFYDLTKVELDRGEERSISREGGVSTAIMLFALLAILAAGWVVARKTGLTKKVRFRVMRRREVEEIGPADEQ